MDKKINEGQTQVYMNGGIEPQYGVNTDAIYLNSPPKQLLDLVSTFMNTSDKTRMTDEAEIIKGGGLSDSQILTILVGMGTPQQLAQTAIEMVRASEFTKENNNQKNHNKMNFTLTELYQNVMNGINSLKEMSTDDSRVSYSAKSALNILENALNMFPRDFYQSFVSLKDTDNMISLSEEVETKMDPSLKYKIAKNIHNSLTPHNWINPVKSILNYINEMYKNSKWSFRISEAIEKNSTQKNPLYETLNNDLKGVLRESNVKESFTKIAMKHPWDISVKEILNEMAYDDKMASANEHANIISTFSPVIINENGINFYLYGKTYSMKDNKIEESKIEDQRFFNVLEGLKLFKYNNDKLVIFGNNDKTLEYSLTEGTILIGDLNLTDKTAKQIKEAVIGSNLFGYRESYKADIVAKFFESVDLLYEMDNFTNIQSKEFLDLFLTVISVEEGVWINTINNAMHINEMKFYESAEEAVKAVKEFINYDISAILSKELVAEGNAKAIIEKLREEINDKISFLEGKKKDLTAAVKRIGDSEELTEALDLVCSEIAKFEKELQETFSVTEKKTKKDYLNDGYVDATVTINGNGLKKDQEVLVNAEEYTSLGDKDLINVIDPKTDKSVYIPRGSLKVSI